MPPPLPRLLDALVHACNLETENQYPKTTKDTTLFPRALEVKTFVGVHFQAVSLQSVERVLKVFIELTLSQFSRSSPKYSFGSEVMTNDNTPTNVLWCELSFVAPISLKEIVFVRRLVRVHMSSHEFTRVPTSAHERPRLHVLSI